MFRERESPSPRSALSMSMMTEENFSYFKNEHNNLPGSAVKLSCPKYLAIK